MGKRDRESEHKKENAGGGEEDVVVSSGFSMSEPRMLDHEHMDRCINLLDEHHTMRSLMSRMTDAVNRTGVQIHGGLDAHQRQDAREWFQHKWGRFTAGVCV